MMVSKLTSFLGIKQTYLCDELMFVIFITSSLIVLSVPALSTAAAAAPTPAAAVAPPPRTASVPFVALPVRLSALSVAVRFSALAVVSPAVISGPEGKHMRGQ